VTSHHLTAFMRDVLTSGQDHSARWGEVQSPGNVGEMTADQPSIPDDLSIPEFLRPR
jgi:hypothetical protein